MKLDVVTIYELQQNFAELAKLLRKKKGLTQDELAKELNLSRATIQNLENGENIKMSTFLLVLQNFELKDRYAVFLDQLIKEQYVPNLYDEE